MNRTILIALVGGQAMPVNISIAEIKPDLLVLVCSQETKNQADVISKKFSAEKDIRIFAPVDMTFVMSDAKKLLEEFKDDKVIINLTSGTKPWTIAFALLAQQYANTQILYVDQNCNFYNYTTGESWFEKTDINMERLMDFNNALKPKGHTLLSDYTDEDLTVLKRVKKLRRQIPEIFNKLTIPGKEWRNRFEGDNEGKQYLQDSYSKKYFIEWNKKQNYVHVVAKDNRLNIDKTFESPNVMHIVFKSGWFEYEVAKLVSEWEHAKEVWLNVSYPYKVGMPKNEIDVIVNTGVKLLMIECKTQIFDNTDIDKFSSAVKNYGGMGCKALFITSSRMKEQAKEKCSDNRIMSFSLGDYKSDQEAQKPLFKLLNDNLISINAK